MREFIVNNPAWLSHLAQTFLNMREFIVEINFAQ
jgi:hypothetical protein